MTELAFFLGLRMANDGPNHGRGTQNVKSINEHAFYSTCLPSTASFHGVYLSIYLLQLEE